METIRLPRGEWSYDPDLQLGPSGGFGAVFAGQGSDGRPVAVKRLHMTAADAAHRELRIAAELAGRRLSHVIPVFDAGEDAGSGHYFVVMARAERSLLQEIRRGSLPNDREAAELLLQIARGLAEVDDLVHRDLKPGNVLLHDGSWKVADFGIARFVEDSTSLHTLKDCLSPPYAAPEQWRFDRATVATDVYALGCIGYALLSGAPPFTGPAREDFARQHQHEPPPALSGHDPRLVSTIGMMLRKSPAARPSLSRVISLLSTASSSSDVAPGFAALAKAGAVAAERAAAADVIRHSELVTEDRRKRLANDAKDVLRNIVEDLFDRIERAAPAASRTERPLSIRLGDAVLSANIRDGVVPADAFVRSRWDVIAAARIVVQQAKPRYEWSASLWYVRTEPKEDYRWQEASYFVNPLARSARERHPFAPFALTEDFAHADEAAAPVIGTYQFAWGPEPIDDENAEAFANRWAALLADAAQGNISYPRSLPLR
jgi:eukaryotic-like serine/threonine-protein kinase